MLPLDSPKWGELDYAYGTAEKIPDAIRSMEEPVDVKFFDEFGNDIFHSSTIYSATFAAIPHLAAIAARRSPSDLHRHGLIVFIGHVAESYFFFNYQPFCPAELLPDFEKSLNDTKAMILESLATEWSDDDFRQLLYGLAALGNHCALACALDGRVGCPECGTAIDPFGPN